MFDVGAEPWPVRIRGPHGVVGAGMAVHERHVLTCAHVVRDAGATTPTGTAPDAPVDVDLIGQPGTPTVSARVVPGCWAPPGDDGRGDVALLELAVPLSRGPFAPLRRVRPWGRRVVVCGFPETVEHGLHVRARLAGPAGAGREWVQMDSDTTGPQIIQGFSGAAVVDSATGHVVGMVVSAYDNSDGEQLPVAGRAPASGLSWMIPVETILRYLPPARAWVSGEPSVDRDFLRLDHASADPTIASQLADFFEQRRFANVLILVLGHPGSGTAAAVRQAAVSSSREFRPPAGPTGDPDDRAALLPVGSIDLAVDVAGKSTREVSQRIADWAGETDGGTDVQTFDTAPQALIINNIDEADDPDKLLSTVVLPMVDQAPARGLRLLLTFRNESVPLRITLLASRVASLRATEEAARRAYRKVATLVADAPPTPSRATELRVLLTTLRAAVAAGGPDSLAADLAAAERVTDRALRKAEAVRQQLVGLAESWSELSGRLDGFLAQAIRHGLAEDPVLSPIYRRAHELLVGGDCDLVAADAAVRRYSEALVDRIADGSQRGAR
ncbi:serine protease [Micromonospora sp. FIMYZ51]|uniref:serine protease n=1 Tax=Micromonospora sp. FIMYZ51 TaxID=3051832 RepID=UPI00312008E7